MTQTNNEREAFEKWFDENYPFLKNSKRDRENCWEGWWARSKSPISQNEHQEAVTNLWEALGKWSAYLASNGEQANLAPPSWLIDAVSSATSPHKQAIPEGWKLVPIEPTPKMVDATWNDDELIKNMSHNRRNKHIYKAMIKAIQTASLTSETNTEVGE